MEKPYYVQKVGEDRYNIRQERYRAKLAAGKEHPHDVMAAHFTAQGIRELEAKHFPGKVDLSGLEQEPAQ